MSTPQAMPGALMISMDEELEPYYYYFTIICFNCYLGRMSKVPNTMDSGVFHKSKKVVHFCMWFGWEPDSH